MAFGRVRIGRGRWFVTAGIVISGVGVALATLLPIRLVGDRVPALDVSLALLAASLVADSARKIKHPSKFAATALAPLIAIVGCDGSGKSTLANDMLAKLRQDRDTEICYLGLGSGDIGNRIKSLPLVGPAIERLLSSRAKQTRTKGARIPGLATALVVYGFSMMRRRRFRRMLALRSHGVTVITDRYPQIEVPGFFDGPGLSAARAGSRFVAWLAARERRMYERMASYQPDVVIRLNVDADTAYARKPDHDLALLRAKVAATPLLKFNGARIVDLDSRSPYPQVRERAFETALRTIARPPQARVAA